MAAADGVDARARRVAARLLSTRARRSAQRPVRPVDPARISGGARHAVGGHPARAARVSRAVRALEPEGWVALERVHRPGGHAPVIDQLIIGPGGIVVVDSHAWVGRIEVTRGVVQQNGFWREQECAEVARTAGSVAALLLPQHRTAVHAVICVAQHDLSPHLVAPGVHVVGVTGLARVLRSLPPRLHPAEVLQLHTQLRHLLGAEAPPEQLTTADFDLLSGQGGSGCVVDADGVQADGVPAGAVPAGPGPGRSLRAPARRRRSSRRRWGFGFDWRLLVARLLLAVLIVAGAVVLGPEVFQGSLSNVPAQPVVPVLPYSPPTGAPGVGVADIGAAGGYGG